MVLRNPTGGVYSGHMTTTPEHPTARRWYFPAADGRGKYHLRSAVTGEAACGSPVILDGSPLAALVYDANAERVHPIVCRRCRRIAQAG